VTLRTQRNRGRSWRNSN